MTAPAPVPSQEPPAERSALGFQLATLLLLAPCIAVSALAASKDPDAKSSAYLLGYSFGPVLVVAVPYFVVRLVARRDRRRKAAIAALVTTVFVLLVSLANAGNSALASKWKPSKPGEIFRFTAVGTASAMDSIILGKEWTSAKKYGAAAHDTLSALPPKAFGSAEAMRVRRDVNGIVRGLEFDYGKERDVEKIEAEYNSLLGKPAESITDPIGDNARHITVWRDSRTEFRIIHFTSPHASIAATAVLSDR